jgi:hypothetical protein
VTRVSDPLDLRASDADRERTIAHLRAASGEGRLTFEELADRVERADGARTAGELAELTADLPEPSRPLSPAAAEPRQRSRWVVAIMSGADRRGRWRPDRRTNVVAVMGGADIDLREAVIDQPEVEINAVTVMGGIDVIVPEDVDVEVTGFALMGGNSSPRDAGPRHPGAPVVHVRAFSLMGGVDVKRRGPRQKRT